MTASEYTTIIAAIGVILMQILGILVQAFMAWLASKKVAVVADDLKDGNVKMLKDVAEIHENTNGHLSELRKELAEVKLLLGVKTAELAESKLQQAQAVTDAKPQDVKVVNTPNQPVPIVAPPRTAP